MKNISAKKLSSYSALALGVIALKSADAQVAYTDIDPDTLLSFTGENMFIDINDDGTNDLELHALFGVISIDSSYGTLTYSTNELIATPLAGCEIAIDYLSRIKLLSPEKEINSATFAFSFTGLSAPVANISDYEPTYMAIKFSDGAGTHFGWLRLHAVADGVEILDYAYEISDGAPITTHAPNTPYAVKNISVTDVADLHNASDIQISFEVPDDESAIASYRVIISSFGYIPLETANTLTTASYTEVFPDGTDKLFTINASQVDNFGNPLEEFVWLNVFVESVSNVKPEESVLLFHNDVFVYGYQTDSVRNIIPEQTDEGSPWQSININFTSPAMLDGIVNFFSFITPADELPVTDSLFYFMNENNIVLNKYEVATGEFHPLTNYSMSAPSLDVNGNEIEYGIPYAACIQSHTLWPEYSDYRYETLSCSAAFTLIDPETSVENPEPSQNFISSLNNLLLFNLPPDIILPANFELLNLSGQLVFATEVNNSTKQIQTELPAGTYIAVLKTNTGTLSQKIIIRN